LSPLAPFESPLFEELAPVVAWVAGALVADTADIAGALCWRAALRLAAFANTCCSSLDSCVRAFVIRALRL
jgi:hypothetical protein